MINSQTIVFVCFFLSAEKQKFNLFKVKISTGSPSSNLHSCSHPESGSHSEGLISPCGTEYSSSSSDFSHSGYNMRYQRYLQTLDLIYTWDIYIAYTVQDKQDTKHKQYRIHRIQNTQNRIHRIKGYKGFARYTRYIGYTGYTRYTGYTGYITKDTLDTH